MMKKTAASGETARKTGRLLYSAAMLAVLSVLTVFTVGAWLAGGIASSGIITGSPEYDVVTELAAYEYDEEGMPIGYTDITESRYNIHELLYGENKTIRLTVTNNTGTDIRVTPMLGKFRAEELVNPQICFFRLDVFLEDPVGADGLTPVDGGLLTGFTSYQDITDTPVTVRAGESVPVYMVISRIGSNDIYTSYRVQKEALEAKGGYTELLAALAQCEADEDYTGFDVGDYKTGDAEHDRDVDNMYTVFQAYNFEINEVPYPVDNGYLIIPEILLGTEYLSGNLPASQNP